MTYTWDANGNLLNDGVNAYTYTAANQLKTMTGPSVTASYAYRCNGESIGQFGCESDRVSQTVNGVTTNYVLDSASPLTQVLQDGTNTYVYGVDRIAQMNGTVPEYFLTDGLGSARQLVDNNGAIVLTKNYDPYGTETGFVGSSATSYGFTGEMIDPTGLLYLRARYYTSDTGRFLTRDTWDGDVNSPMSFNRWMYGYDNPVKYTDPSGHDPYWCEKIQNPEEKKKCYDKWFHIIDYLPSTPTPEPNPVVIIACGYIDGGNGKNAIPCTHGTLASLDLYEGLGKAYRIPVPAWTNGIKWGNAAQIKSLMDSSGSGPIFLVGHSAGADAVTAALSIMTPAQTDKLRGVVILDPTLTAPWHEDPSARCPGEVNYPVGAQQEMAKILLNSTLGRNRLFIYDSDLDGTNLQNYDFHSGAANYSYVFSQGIPHIDIAERQDIYQAARDALQLSK